MSEVVDVLSIAGGPIIGFLKRLTLEIRVVSHTRRRMGRQGHRIDSRRLRQLIYSKGFSARLAMSRADDDPLIADLADVLLGSDRGNKLVAASLRRILVESVRSRLAGASAFADFSDDRNEARTEEIISAIGNFSTDDVLFDQRLSEMHPLRADDFRNLRSEWPATAKWLGAIASTQDRLGLLKRWAAYPPDFGGAPPAFFGLLADLSEDLPGPSSTSTLSIQFIERGLGLGLEPQGYWAVRVVNLKGSEDVGAGTTFLADYRGYPLVEAVLHPDGAKGAIELLRSWSPPTVREELHRSLYLGEYYIRTLKIDNAIKVGREAYERHQSTGAALLAARALLIRHMTDGANANRKDLPDALLLAVKARADRRRWGINSGSALALEIRIRRLISDYDGALDLVNGSGELPADETELAHPDVIAETALLQAQRGDVEIAKRLLSSVAVPKHPHVSAVIAEKEGRVDDARKFFAAAIEATEDLSEQTDLALQLAFHGIHSPTTVAKLAVDNPGIAEELEQTAALFAHEAGALEEFRGFANAQYRGALYFYLYLHGEGENATAAAWAREGGKKWGDPDLLVESARYFGHIGQFAEVISDLGAALLLATNEWGGRRDAFRMLVEAYARSGDWNEALSAAANLVATEPNNPSAAWAVVMCQIRLNDLTGALRSWQQHGSPEPRSEAEVGAWIELLGIFGPVVGTAHDALLLSTKFATDERIRGALVGVFFLREKPLDDSEIEQSDDEEVNDPEIWAFREMLAAYIRDFPNGAIKQVSIDMEDPLASIRDQFSESAGLPELDEQVAKGALPVGILGEAYGKTYTETLLANDRGPVFAGSADLEAEESAMVAAHEIGAVIDLSALATLGRLPAIIRGSLSGHFPNVRALTEHQRDTMVGRRAIARDSGLSYRPRRGEVPEAWLRRTPQEVSERTALADEIEQSFSRFVLVSHPQLAALAMEERDFDKPFLLGVDLALGLAVPLWADDTALKEVIRSEGGKAFGTPELLNHLKNESSLDLALIDLAEAELIARGYSGLRFNRSAWDLAVSLAPTPAGLINAIRHAGRDDADNRYQIANELIDSYVDEPDVFEAFVFAVAQWLETIAPSEETAAQNVIILARSLLGRPWMSSSTLPYCVRAFRAVTGRTDATALLLREIFRTFESIADRANDEAAALVVFELVSRLDPKDGLRVRSSVLGRVFQ